jgi:exopolysaccharide biosynthesis protein
MFIRRHITKWSSFFLLFVFVFGFGETKAADNWSTISNGILHLHRQDVGDAGPRNIHVLKIDLRTPNLVIRPILAQDSWGSFLETTSSMAFRTGAVAAINGDYFGPSGPPEGTTIIFGTIYDVESYRRSTFALSDDNSQVDIGIWTSEASLPKWVYNAISGGTTILRNELYDFDPYNENFSDSFKAAKKGLQPRTGIAISEDKNTLLLAVVDGRQPGFSVGMTAEEFANLMIELGGFKGMDLDGGGSTTMVINEDVINKPSDDGVERSVANALGIFITDECHQLDWSTGMPYAGYGAPYDVFSPNKETSLAVECGDAFAKIKVGNDQQTLFQLIYKYGYYYRIDHWERYTLTPQGATYGGVWYEGTAETTIPLTTDELEQQNYAVAYICTWIGNSWKCGCRDSICSSSYWQLQTFGQPSSTAFSMTSMAESDVAEAQNSSVPPPPPPPPGNTPEIIVIEPNGGEIIPSGSTYTINWYAPAQAATFTLGFSTNMGKKWKKIESGITGTAYDWTVPAPNKNLMNCLIKVTAFDSAGKNIGGDKSDAPFAIEVLTLTTPNGGEAIASGSSYNVSWDTYDTQNPVDHVKIFCSTAGGKKKKKRKWKLMATEPGDPGISTCEFPVPKKNMTNCLIKAVAYDYTGAKVAEDQSDGPFTIEVASVISPNGGETLYGGDVVSIDWQTYQTVKEVAKVVLKYTFNGGKKWKTIETITGDNPGTYLWTVPAVPEEKDKCKVMVQLKDEKGKGIGFDTSDSYFAVF